MKNRYLAVLLVCVFVLFSACGKKTQEETIAPTEQIQQTEAVQETEKVKIDGLADSIFDDETVPPAETVPPTQSGSENNSASSDNTGDGLHDPDAPEQDPGSSQKPQATQPPAAPETQPAETQPAETQPAPTTPPAQSRSEYEEFQNMSPSQQQEHMNSFESIDAFFNWYNAAREEHDKMYPDIEIGGGSVDMGDILGGNK